MWLGEVPIWQTLKNDLVNKSMQCIKFEHTEQLFQSSKINNLYKLDVATFVYKINEILLWIFFFQGFKKLFDSNPNRFVELNYEQPIHNIKTSKYSISFREPYI